MISIVIGLLSILIFLILLFPVLPWEFFHLTHEILYVLKGGIPIIIALFGVLSIIIGITDILDRNHAKKEMKLQEEFEKSEQSS